jgi:Transposase DDE domain/Domain of unknown function (DUF4372)
MSKLTLFSQIVSKIDRFQFKSLVAQDNTDKFNKGVNSWTHFVSMIFCQFSKSNSLRDISNGLRSATGNLNHLGLSKAPSKSSLSYQNKHRNWKLFEKFYFTMLDKLSAEAGFKQIKFKIKSKIYLLDSTTITLCLSLFDWAKYKTAKGAIKLHTLLDYDGNLPAFINMTDGKVGDNKGASDIPLVKNSVVVGDRAYFDTPLLNKWDSMGVFFVIRMKENIKYTTLKELELPDNRHQHILKDEIVELSGLKTQSQYPKRLRRVAVYDEKNDQVIELITNQLSWTANTISELYKARWQIEIFFKEIKQLLKIKSFIGTTENAVMIQVWTAMITILLLKFLKAVAKYSWHLSNLVSFLRLNLFVKISLQKWLDEPFEKDVGKTQENQLSLF